MKLNKRLKLKKRFKSLIEIDPVIQLTDKKNQIKIIKSKYLKQKINLMT